MPISRLRRARALVRVMPSPAQAAAPTDGVLLLDKPPGLTSNDALQKAKRLFRAEKAGIVLDVRE